MSIEASVALRVKPGASRTHVGGSHPGPFGEAVVVAVSARPVDGAATEAAVQAIAKALAIKPRQVRVSAGHASRDKLVVISDPPEDLSERVSALRAR